MVAIKFSLTPADYEEIERERRVRLVRRIVRISFGSFAGFVGVYTIWQTIYVFPWKHPHGNLLIACMGLFCVWGGLEMPGLTLLLRRISDPYAECELQIDDGKITCLRNRKSSQFQWRPSRGFKESEKFFFVQSLRNEAKWTIPKRAVTPEQELNLRELVRAVSAD